MNESRMTVIRHPNATEFLSAAAGLLEANEAGNNLILGLAGRLARADAPTDKPAVMMSVGSGADRQGVAFMTPPRPALIYLEAQAPREPLDALVQALLACGQPVSGGIVPSYCANHLLDVWRQRMNQSLALKRPLRAFELRRVTLPRDVPGRPRLAQETDVDLVADWLLRFGRELDEPGDAESTRKTAVQGIADRHMLLWEDGGQPVSQALVARPTRRGTCIAVVYTPPDRRGHGYASACVAALSQRLLDEGREFVCLYTDRGSPVPNRIYPRVGYAPVMDWEHYEVRQDEHSVAHTGGHS